MLIDKLNTLSKITGRNDKIATVKDFIIKDPTFRRVCHLALDPLINYGIATVPSVNAHRGTIDLDHGLDIIESIAGSTHSNATIELVANLLGDLNEYDSDVISRIINRDLRCGVQIATYNAAVDQVNYSCGTTYQRIFEYPCLLVSPYSDKIRDKLWKSNQWLLCQQKCDGMRFNAIVTENDVVFHGRSGKVITIKDQSFYQIFRQFGTDVVIDGELLVDGKSDGSACDRKTGNGIINKAVKGTISESDSHRITATIWDIIPLRDFKAGLCKIHYIDRYNYLVNVYNKINSDRVFIVNTDRVTTNQQIENAFNMMIERGLEGVIVKDPNDTWSDRRTTNAYKVKGENECDLIVIDWIEGTGRFTNVLGALVCESRDHKVRVNVGTGFTEQQRQMLTRENTIGKIVSITYNMRITDKNRDVDSLFLPRFTEIREDKEIPDSSVDIK